MKALISLKKRQKKKLNGTPTALPSAYLVTTQRPTALPSAYLVATNRRSAAVWEATLRRRPGYAYGFSPYTPTAFLRLRLFLRIRLRLLYADGGRRRFVAYADGIRTPTARSTSCRAPRKGLRHPIVGRRRLIRP